MRLRARIFRLLLGIMLACSVLGWSSSGPDKAKLRQLLERDVLKESLAGKHVYVSSEPLPGGKYIHSWRTKFQVPLKFSRAWFFFVDDMPDANWEHPCRYVFVDTRTHRHVIIKASTPPDDVSKMTPLEPQP